VSETSLPKPSRLLLANPLATRASRDEALSVCAGENGGQGRGPPTFRFSGTRVSAGYSPGLVRSCDLRATSVLCDDRSRELRGVAVGSQFWQRRGYLRITAVNCAQVPVGRGRGCVPEPPYQIFHRRPGRCRSAGPFGRRLAWRSRRARVRRGRSAGSRAAATASQRSPAGRGAAAG
jgi:hypothetical protein